MAIRITGMYSGLDTESIITQLASAQSVKKNNLVKEQTKLSWKQDAWKALNTKIYNFYTNVLDGMRFQSAYLKKATKVSNSSAVSVVTDSSAPNSVQTMKIQNLAKEAYLTGGRISEEGGKKYSESTKLSELGFTGEGSFAVKVGNKTTNIKVTGDMKISDVVKQFESAGLTASFDAKNQRFYLSSKNSGAAADFTITSNDANGQDILSKLGLGSTYNKDSSEYKEYAIWASYADSANASARADAEAAEAAKRAAAKKASTDSLLKTNETLQKKLDDLRKTNAETNKYDETPAKDLYDELYGEEVEVTKTDDDGVTTTVTERNGGLKKDLDDANAALKEAQDKLAELRKNNASEADIQAAEQEVADKSEAASNAKKAFDEKKAHYNYVKSVEDTQAAIDKNNNTITDNETYYTEADGKVTATAKMEKEVTDYFKDKIAAAQQYMQDAEDYAKLSEAEKEALADKRAMKIDGKDAVITLNGVKYTNSTNTFEINGLTITAQSETNEEITLTTTEDAEGVYDMIKNFFTEYNKLINEMSSLYNADAAKGYEPLLSEEKAQLADSEVEEWEKKIKDSLLRRDSTLGDVSDAMKTVMLQGATVNGKKMYLSDFGINTLGYFSAADNEKSAYHIDGDKDDPTVSKETDKLRQMLASDPDTVMNFFSGLTKNLYDKLTDKMKSVKDTSSAFTVYNDKSMKKEYDNYKDLIAKEESKLNDLMDKWYSKFSVMETTLAKLQSKNNALSGMLGGG